MAQVQHVVGDGEGVGVGDGGGDGDGVVGVVVLPTKHNAIPAAARGCIAMAPQRDCTLGVLTP